MKTALLALCCICIQASHGMAYTDEQSHKTVKRTRENSTSEEQPYKHARYSGEEYKDTIKRVESYVYEQLFKRYTTKQLKQYTPKACPDRACKKHKNPSANVFALRVHRLRAHNEYIYLCMHQVIPGISDALCLRAFSNRKDLCQHPYNAEHTFCCFKCDTPFLSVEELQCHLRMYHLTKDLYPCLLCKADKPSFRIESDLYEHLLYEHTEYLQKTDSI